MNFAVKLGAKALLKGNLRNKIIIAIVASMMPLIVTIIIVAKVIGPFADFVEGVTEFADKASSFFTMVGNKTENFLQGRGFTIIDEEKIKEEEQAIYNKLTEKYNTFQDYEVELDIPLIAATIYYPMTFIYDEQEIIDLNNEVGQSDETTTEEQEEQLQDIYDYNKKIKDKYITALVNKSISQTITTYKCESETTTADDGTETTRYFQGDYIDSTGPQEFDGELKHKEVCAEGMDSMRIYIYQNDPERYEAYLRDEHILSNEAYKPLFKDLDGAAQTVKMDSVISGVYDLKGLYADLLGINPVIAGRYSSLCTTGVVVSGGDANSAQGVYSLEDYIAGVVENENSWYQGDNIESMKAQAIAARTYLLKRTNNCAIPIENSQSAQKFLQNPSDKAKQAANETAGMVLTYNGEMFSSEYDSFDCASTCLEGMCTCEYTMEPEPIKHIVEVPASFVTNKSGGHGRGMSQFVARYLQTKGYSYQQILEYFYSPGVQIVQTGGAETGMDGIVAVQGGIFVIPANMDSGLSGSRGSGPSGFNTFFWERLSDFFAKAAAAGYDISYTDAWRSYDAQVNCYNNPEKIIDDVHLCAIPGKSMHGWGIAADLNFENNKSPEAAQNWAHDNAGNSNLRFPLCIEGGACSEPWHIEPLEIERK